MMNGAPDAHLESRATLVGGRKMHAWIGGRSTATPIVLVHGLGVSSRYLLPTARALAGSFAVHAPDLPGFGRSQAAPRSLGIEELAAALLAWMDAVGLERPSLLANSMGCQVVVELAIMAPERVSRLVLVGPTVDPRWRTLSRQLPRWLLEMTREPLSIFPILIGDYLRCGPRRFLETARFALAHRLEERLPFVGAPTLVVRGERDAFASAEWARRVAELLPHGVAATIPGVGHAANYAAPEALASLVGSFVPGVRRERDAGRTAPSAARSLPVRPWRPV